MANVSAFTGAMPVIPGGTVELAYSTVTTASISISSSSPGTGATSIVPPMTVVCDGGPVEIRCFLPQVVSGATTGSAVFISLLKDGAEFVRYWAVVAQANVNAPCLLTYRDAPTSGSHTYEVRAYNYLSNGIVYAGNGTTTQAPITLTVSKIVNQNDGLKPFWTPPIVTQLPSQATVGDQVLYAADATNGVYWQLQYDGLGTYPWKFIGGPALYSEVLPDQTTTSTSFTDLGTVGPSVTAALPGDYDILFGSRSWNSLTNNETRMGVSLGGAAVNTGAGHFLFNFMAAGGSPAPGGAWHTSKVIRATGFAGGSVTAKYCSQPGGTSWFAARFLTVTPIRVKAP